MQPHSLFSLSAGLREEAANDGRPFRQLIYVKPEEHLDVLVERLTANEVSSAPCLTTEPDGTLLAQSYQKRRVSLLGVITGLSRARGCLSALSYGHASYADCFAC